MELLEKPLPSREFIIDPWLHQQGIAMVYAWRGIGKTWIALNLAYMIASGGEFLNWSATEPRKVLYLDGEMPASVMQERLASIVRANKDGATIKSDDYFQLLTNDLQETGIPYLDTPEGQERMKHLIEKADVIFVDNVSTLTSQPENESQGWQNMQHWLLQQRRNGKTIILIHHAGKGGAQRGTSKREDILDVVIKLQRSKDYIPEDGACFELHFEKSRSIDPDKTSPLMVKALDTNQGLQWKAEPLVEDFKKRIIALQAEGLTEKEIYEELGISRATYYRRKNKLGILKP